MRLRRYLLAVAILSSTVTAPLTAQLAPDWFGTWHLDVANSTFVGTPPYARGTWKVSQAPDGDVVMIYDQVGKRGGVTHMEWKGPFDGSDRRLHGPDALVTYAYTRIDDRTLDLLVKVDGHPSARARVVLSSDGVVTATTESATASGRIATKTVYRKHRS